jgi:hypothetical protein
MKLRAALVTLLIFLACIVPLSSRRPDAVQHVLGLAGGVDGAIKALGGILAAAALTTILLFSLRKLGGKP